MMAFKLWRYASYRNFSSSTLWRNLEKKIPEPPTSTSSSSEAFEFSRMPTNFEKKLLIYSGVYKTMEEIPKLMSSDTLDKAKSKIRIKIGNLMIIGTLILCGTIIYNGKSRRKENIQKYLESKGAEKAEQNQIKAS